MTSSAPQMRKAGSAPSVFITTKQSLLLLQLNVKNRINSPPTRTAFLDCDQNRPLSTHRSGHCGFTLSPCEPNRAAQGDLQKSVQAQPSVLLWLDCGCPTPSATIKSK